MAEEVNQYQRRKEKEKSQEPPKKININRGVVRVTALPEPKETPVQKVYVGSQGNDFLTEGLE